MLGTLAELSASAKEENASLMSLSEQAQRDARFMKIITFVALLYLPATLIAVSKQKREINESEVDMEYL
jgi:hypothetical protein